MILCSPEDALERVVSSLHIERNRSRFLRRFLKPEDLAIVRREGKIDARTPDIAIRPEPLILRLADRMGWSDRRTIAEVGYGLEMLTTLDFQELCEYWGEESQTAAVVVEETTVAAAQTVIEAEETTQTTPEFSDDGILRFRGKSIKFSSRQRGSAISRIAAAFEAAGWPTEIDFPFDAARPEDMHGSRRRLQERVNEIGLAFSVDVPRYVISWRPRACISGDRITNE